VSTDSAGPFAVGSAVRVKPGVTDPDFPDRPLGGWSGTVRELDADESPPLCLVAWDRRTLEGIDPEHRRRCERDGLDYDSMWLAADALEPVPTEGPAPRVRAVFGLPEDALLPEVNADSLRRYHAHLSERLSFPFAAVYRDNASLLKVQVDPVLVLRLLPPEEAKEGRGLLAEVVRGDETLVLPLAAIECAEPDAHRQPLADYAHWLRRAAPRQAAEAPYPPPEEQVLAEAPAQPGPLSRLLLLGALVAAAGGSALGAVLEAVEGARLGAEVGAAVLACVGAAAGARYFRSISRSPSAALTGGLCGAVGGAPLGALVGALAVAYVGSIPGSIVGVLLGRVLAGLGRKPVGEVGWCLLGACAGGLVLALYHDQPAAARGCVTGAVVGAAAGVVLLLAFLVALASLTGFRR
jgi:hypothetical protein